MMITGINKIAIFRALQLGDTLCAIPAVRAIRHAFPEASITLIGLPWQRKIVERFDHYFNDFIEFPGWPGLPEQPFVPSRIPVFLQEVQQREFDLVVQMQGDGVLTNPMCLLFGARYTAGLRLEGQFCPHDELFPVFTEKDHEVLRFLKIVEALEIPAKGIELECPVTSGEIDNFNRICNELKLESKRYVCVHPGSRNPDRRWAPSNFAKVADAVAEEGYTVVITGSEYEKEVMTSVQNGMKHNALNIVERLGAVGLGELALLIKNAAALVSNDTGVSHLAAAMKTPSVVIYSPFSDPRRWAPLNRDLHAVISFQEANHPENVLQALKAHLPNISDQAVSGYGWSIVKVNDGTPR